MTRQTLLEQERGQQAWKIVKVAKGKDKKHQKGFKSIARSGPADIQMNGLGQTLAFWYAKSSDEHFADLYHSVSDWAKSQIKDFSEGDILEWITESADMKGYRRATQETIAFLNWVKRFAEAELEGE